MNIPEPCPCGSGQTFGECCGPFLAGTAFPPTAEALMRSRYTAYTRAEVPYIIATVAAERRHLHTPQDVASFAKESQWLRLEIVDRKAGGEPDQVGTVEFKAWFMDKKGLQCLHERSNFQREDGQWRYKDGSYPGRPWQATIGRNDPCPCGSGKKFKKCHGQRR